MNPTGSATRRNFLAGTLGAGALATGLGPGMLLTPKMTHAAEPIAIPLPYAFLKHNGKLVPVLDPEDVRYNAYNHYFQGGCMHGAATGLIMSFKDAFRNKKTDWDLFPLGIYKYGAGGISGWGTICGVLNGVVAVLNLVNLHGKLGHEIVGWYSTTLFPTANCEGFVAETGQAAILDREVLAHTISDSPLCHISISKWCRAAGVRITDTSEEGLSYKNDRCSKICADTAAKTAELINEYAENGEIVGDYETPEHFSDCLGCHSERKDQVGKMDCLGCHSPGDAVLVSIRHPQGLWKEKRTAEFRRMAALSEAAPARRLPGRRVGDTTLTSPLPARRLHGLTGRRGGCAQSF
jgi:hypothetical protein